MKASLILAGAIMLSACTQNVTEVSLRNGDLIFVGIPADYHLGSDSMSGAISEATGDGKLNIIHVAIAEVDRDSTFIIDATIAHGVDRHPVDTFLTDFTLRDGSYPVFIVKRLKDASIADKAVENAKQYLGLPYDYLFMPDNGAMYCSELVRESYIGEDGEAIFAEAPMNFLDSEGNMPVYWTRLFERLGTEVPQGVRGTNPHAMSAEPALESVSDNFTF